MAAETFDYNYGLVSKVASRDNFCRGSNPTTSTDEFFKYLSQIPSNYTDPGIFGYTYCYLNYFPSDIKINSEVDKLWNNLKLYYKTVKITNDFSLRVVFKQRLFIRASMINYHIEINGTYVISYIIVNDSDIISPGTSMHKDSYLRYIHKTNRIPMVNNYTYGYYSYNVGKDIDLDDPNMYDANGNFAGNIKIDWPQMIKDNVSNYTFVKTVVDGAAAIPFSTLEKCVLYKSFENGNGPTFRDSFRYSIARDIVYLIPNGVTKTYTNSTWSTKKTWYIKTRFSTGTKNNTYNGSNVVNYETSMLR